MTGVTKCSRHLLFVVILFGTLVTFVLIFRTSIHRKSDGVIWLKNSITVGMERPLYNERVEDTDVAAKKDNDKRVRRLHRECQHHHQDVATSLKLDHVIVDDKYKMLFCYIPKISCSQWKLIFIKMTGKVRNSSLLDFGTVHTTYQSHLSFLSDYNTKDRNRIMNNYKKYIIVRNPLERLLSAYRNKFAGNGFHDILFQRFGRIIVKRYRPNATRTSLDRGNDVTFLEFVKYLTDYKTTHYNDHWERYTELCQPCLIKYDFVGKYETLNRDADFLLKDIGAPPDIRFPKRSETYKTKETMTLLEKYYSQIPVKTIAKLRQIYKYDFDLFGYTVPANLQGV